MKYLLVILALFSAQASAAEFSTQYYKDTKTARIDMIGDIQYRDNLKLALLVADATRKGYKVLGLRLNSSGGNVVGSVATAIFVRENNMTTSVIAGASCGSACFYIWAAGVKRFASYQARVGVHSVGIPAVGKNGEDDISEDEGSRALNVEVSRWLIRDMGVNPFIVGVMVNTPPTDGYIFTQFEYDLMKAERF